MSDLQTYDVDPTMKRAIEIKLAELENQIEIAHKSVDCLLLLELETEHHVLGVFWRVLDSSAKDSGFLDRKKIQPIIRPSILESLNPKSRVEIVCLTQGKCGI